MHGFTSMCACIYTYMPRFVLARAETLGPWATGSSRKDNQVWARKAWWVHACPLWDSFDHKHCVNGIRSGYLEWFLQTEMQQLSSKEAMLLLRHVLLASQCIISLLALSSLQPCVTEWDWFILFMVLSYGSLAMHPGQEEARGRAGHSIP